MSETEKSLTGIRVLAALNGLELFGHERGNIEVFKTLRNLGAEVMVGVNALPENDVADELRRLGFATFSLPFGPQWSIQWVKEDPRIVFTNFQAVYRCSKIFLRTIKKYCPTHIHLGSPLAYSYVAMALVLSKVPLIYRMGDGPPVNSWFNLPIWRMAMRRSAHVVCISRYIQSVAIAAGTESTKTTVIYNLAPTGSASANGDGACNEKYGKDRLLYVGSISEHKGLLPLITAFAQIAPEHPSLNLDIVGGSRYDADFRNQLLQLISQLGLDERVMLHGYICNLSDFYMRALIHVAPSIWEEPLGHVVIEAKREGTASVIFPSGGLPEMVRHRVDGYICREKSVEALIEAFRWMLADKERLVRMGAAARGDLDERFGLERFQHAWAAVYRSVTW